jgi:hypothetical protein
MGPLVEVIYEVGCLSTRSVNGTAHPKVVEHRGDVAEDD